MSEHGEAEGLAPRMAGKGGNRGGHGTVTARMVPCETRHDGIRFACARGVGDTLPLAKGGFLALNDISARMSQEARQIE